MHGLTKTLTILTIVLLATSNLFSQVVNINPNKNGDPWFVGGVKQLSKEDVKKAKNEITQLSMSKEYIANRNFPSEIDNSTQPYFRPVFVQLGGSCSQASGVAYIYTYEVNYIRGLSSDIPENQYPSHFTYNFLNNGNGDNGSNYWSGWKIIQEMGCPTVAEYGGLNSMGNTGWLSGYNNYLSATQNTIYKYYSIDVGSEEGLETLKGWFVNHLDNNQNIGGIACFSAGAADMSIKHLPLGTPHSTDFIVTDWGETIDHAMTFVGYNDSIRYDYNQDGMYTNDIDINNDGTVNMADWEIGGLIFVNSWGVSWADNGKSYMMYRLLADTVSIGRQQVYVVEPKDFYSPDITFKVKMNHPSRDKLKISASVTNDTSLIDSDFEMKYKALQNKGGNLPMTGTSDTIEFALDVTSIFKQVHDYEEMKFSIQVIERDSDNVAEGSIINFSVLSYLNGITEYACLDSNVAIVNEDSTYLSVTIPGNNFYPPDSLNSIATNNNVELNWESPINHPTNWHIDAYKLYRDNDLLATITDSSQFSYVDNNLDDGSYTYSISCLYYDGIYFHESMVGNETTQSIIINPVAGAGHCLYFNGSNAYIEADSIEIANKSFTMEFWSKKLPAGGDDMVIGHGQWNQGSKAIHFGFRDNKLYCGFWADDISTDTTYKDADWHHYAMSFDNSIKLQSLYRDGELVKTRTSDTTYLGTGKVYIGTVSSISRFYRGYLDEIRIWDTLRTAEEIQSKMYCPLTGNEPNLISYWQFDEPRGNICLDKSSLQNNGVLNNFSIEHSESGLWTRHNIDSDSTLVLFTGYSPINSSLSVYELLSATSGTISIDENNATISYTPDINWTGYDSLSWIINDGISTDSCMVYINPDNFPVLSNNEEQEKIINELDISVYPNPVTDYLSIENNKNKNLYIRIYNSMGVLIHSESTHNRNNMIDCSQYSSGSYFLIISNKNITKEVPFIVNH